MTTFADVESAAEGTLAIFVDEEVLPAGYFGATALVREQSMAAYLFEGKPGNPTSVVKGRIEEQDGQLIGYAQGGLTGGTELGKVQNYKETFAQMV